MWKLWNPFYTKFSFSVFWQFSTVAVCFCSLVQSKVMSVLYFCCFLHLYHCCGVILYSRGVIKVWALSSWKVSNLEKGRKMFKKNLDLVCLTAKYMRKVFSDCRPVPVPYELLFVSTTDWNCLFNTRYLPPLFLLLSFSFSQIVCQPGSSYSDWEAHQSWRVSEATLAPQEFCVVCFDEFGTGR